jgi:hypothetical protein
MQCNNAITRLLSVVEENVRFEDRGLTACYRLDVVDNVGVVSGVSILRDGSTGCGRPIYPPTGTAYLPDNTFAVRPSMQNHTPIPPMTMAVMTAALSLRDTNHRAHSTIPTPITNGMPLSSCPRSKAVLYSRGSFRVVQQCHAYPHTGTIDGNNAIPST